MLSVERLGEIRQLLEADGKVVASQLADRFGVSEDTVRRDLRELARAGLCRRVYGGALAPAPAPDLGSITARAARDGEAKRRLAAAAVPLLRGCRAIFIDGGSTNIEIARALPRDQRLTVITNAPAIALALGEHPLCATQLIGGSFDREKGICFGPRAIRDIEQVRADMLVLGACGADPVLGLSAHGAEEAEIKRAMAARSAAVLAAVTTNKLGTVAAFKVAEPAQTIHLIADRDADPKLAAAFRRAAFDVHVAE